MVYYDQNKVSQDWQKNDEISEMLLKNLLTDRVYVTLFKIENIAWVILINIKLMNALLCLNINHLSIIHKKRPVIKYRPFFFFIKKLN